MRLSSYLSYQRRKDSGAVAANNEKKAALKLGQHHTVPSNETDEIARKLIKTDNESATILVRDSQHNATELTAIDSQN